MTREEIKAIADASAKAAVKEMLTSLGIDVNDPIQTQHEMNAMRELSTILSDEEYRADQLHLRKWRTAMDAASSLSVKAAIGVLITGLCGVIWIGLKQTLGK